jgi:hypothetical protein
VFVGGVDGGEEVAHGMDVVGGCRGHYAGKLGREWRVYLRSSRDHLPICTRVQIGQCSIASIAHIIDTIPGFSMHNRARKNTDRRPCDFRRRSSKQ